MVIKRYNIIDNLKIKLEISNKKIINIIYDEQLIIG